MSAENEKEQGFDSTPAGQARRWEFELAAADAEVAKFHERGRKIIARFRDERDPSDPSAIASTRWNLYTSSVQTRRDMMYGRVPQVTVGRRFADADDDVARVAGVIQERALNADIERDGDGFQAALRHALMDWELPGLGIARARYVAEFEDGEETPAKTDAAGKEMAPAVPAVPKKSWEDIETDYIHWDRFRWSAGAGVHSEVRWVAFGSDLSYRQLVKKFGEDVADTIPLDSKNTDGTTSNGRNPWARARVWEVWSKEDEKVYFVIRGGEVPVLTPLGAKPGKEAGNIDEDGGQVDPYGLEGFFPCPEWLVANATTDTLVPRAHFSLVQDIYDEIDRVSGRITQIEDAIKVRAVYDKAAAPELAGLLNGPDNTMIPATNFAALKEKGGLGGVMEFMPLEMLVNAVLSLRDYRRELIDAAYQVSGDSDIIRGQATDAGETATAQGLKAKFGSVRMQARQDEFARFASALQKIRAELMVKLFDPQTIIARSNILATPDAQLAEKAVEFLRSKFSCYRIEVKPEAISLTDFAATKQERTEVISAVGQFFTAAQPVAQNIPGSMPLLLKTLRWMLAGLKGASTIEGEFDKAIQQAEQAAQNPQPQAPQQPDPKVMAQQMKGQQDLAKVQAEFQAKAALTKMDAQAEQEKQAAQTNENVREHAMKKQIDMAAHAAMPKPTPGGIPR